MKEVLTASKNLEETKDGTASFVGSPTIDQSLVDLALKCAECISVSRVLVLYTGGTIGMKCVNGSYHSVENFFLPALRKMPTFCDSEFQIHINQFNVEYLHQKLSESPILPHTHNCHSKFSKRESSLTESDHIQTYALPIDKNGCRILYTVVEYWPLLDSSDLGLNEWKRIAQDIYAFYNEFDGFVVLHGTDTLAYTASALSFMLENLGKPVVLTGAQLPVFEFRSDGWNNFLGALMISGGQYAITIAELGTEITVNYNLIFRTPGMPKPFCIHTNLCQDVAILNMFPLISKEHIVSMLAPPIKGNQENLKDLLDALKEASDRGILMVNVTQCWRGGVKAVYSTGMILCEYGVTPGYDITTEAALIKLAYILSKTGNKDYSVKRAMLLSSLRGEVTVEGEDSRAANLSLYNMNFLNQDRNLMTYFAKLFSTTSLNDSEGVGSMWVQRIVPALACCAAASNNVSCLKEMYRIIGHLQLFDAEGLTPLHKSAVYGHISATKYLLECGVSVHITDKRGYTPLLCALNSITLSSEVVQLLLDSGAVLNSESQLVTKLVHQAIALGDIQKLRLYLLCGYSFYNMDEEGRSALHVAVAHRQLNSIKFLISSVNDENKEQHKQDITNKTKTNLEYGAGIDPKCRTSWGTTALDEAKLRHFNDMNTSTEQYIIGIAGASNSGKTTMTRKLVEHLECLGYNVTCLSMDNYYWPRDDIHHIRDSITDHPNYDFEGILIMNKVELRDMMDLRIFLKITYENMVYRRKLRKYNTLDPPNYLDKYVWPAYLHTLDMLRHLKDHIILIVIMVSMPYLREFVNISMKIYTL
ncbi:L-asparaginase [Schistosoma japonicum]|nr:L-asparaginase [Schistosoma japonicum]KAH8872107.1 L-asparaginase [Schistosoma japonicum]KAH8872108.1 L-asparaginase [Schistosoma japonicum]